MKVNFDLETTGKDVYNNEVITGYFECENGECYNFASQVNEWSDEAEAIHGITLKDTKYFLPKEEALNGLHTWLSSLPLNTEFVMYANERTEYGNMFFDCAILENEFSNLDLPFRFKNKISVHSMAKKAYKKKLFAPMKNPKTNRISFKQENVFKAIFGYGYEDAHDAKVDVKSMIKIYDVLNDALTHNKQVNINQTDLFLT